MRRSARRAFRPACMLGPVMLQAGAHCVLLLYPCSCPFWTLNAPPPRCTGVQALAAFDASLALGPTDPHAMLNRCQNPPAPLSVHCLCELRRDLVVHETLSSNRDGHGRTLTHANVMHSVHSIHAFNALKPMHGGPRSFLRASALHTLGQSEEALRMYGAVERAGLGEPAEAAEAAGDALAELGQGTAAGQALLCVVVYLFLLRILLLLLLLLLRIFPRLPSTHHPQPCAEAPTGRDDSHTNTTGLGGGPSHRHWRYAGNPSSGRIQSEGQSATVIKSTT